MAPAAFKMDKNLIPRNPDKNPPRTVPRRVAITIEDISMEPLLN